MTHSSKPKSTPLAGATVKPFDEIEAMLSKILQAGQPVDRHTAANDALIRKLTGNPDQPNPASASVGDIHSSERGSGARFNAGKVPYELVPLCLVASFYDMTIVRDEGGDIDRAIIALDYLGLWQARRDSFDGVNFLYHTKAVLGDGIEEGVRVFAYGAQKYAPMNWAKGMRWTIPMACAARHLVAIIKGESLDPESGLSHRGHVFCNLDMLLEYDDQGTYLEGDDRPMAGMLAPAADPA